MEINVDVIKELVNCLNSSSLDILELETDEFKLSLERSSMTVNNTQPSVAYEVKSTAAPQQKLQTEVTKGNIVKSPIVGTFYLASSPDKPPFVTVGKTIKSGDTLYVVESMKLMNEVTSEFDGTVTEIFVKNAQAIEYGQPIMRIE